MPTLMTARCTQCGHENNPEYRFCGVCGAPLPSGVPNRAPVREQERARVSPVGGPSFLGLGDDRTNDLDYLLEDETPRGHGRMYLALLLLALSAGLLAWHWQRDGYPWADLAKNSTRVKAPASSSPDPSPITAAPAPTPTPVEPPTNGTVAADVVHPSTAVHEPPAEGATPNPITVVKPADQNAQPADASGASDSSAKPPVTTAQDAGATEAVSPPLANDAPAAPTVPVKKLPAVKPSPTIPAPSPEDKLVDEGERYLYGRGVRADCALAQRDLMIGARQSNPKAQTLLGAMYATGHCVGRDLPNAYRWFAKALHGDPANSRLQRDLEVLWKQMTPEERLLAMKN